MTVLSFIYLFLDTPLLSKGVEPESGRGELAYTCLGTVIIQ